MASEIEGSLVSKVIGVIGGMGPETTADFFVKLTDKRIVIVETKGQEDLDVPLKTQRLKQWCEDINQVQSDVTYDFVFVDEESFNKYSPKSFADLVANFRQYKDES